MFTLVFLLVGGREEQQLAYYTARAAPGFSSWGPMGMDGAGSGTVAALSGAAALPSPCAAGRAQLCSQPPCALLAQLRQL